MATGFFEHASLLYLPFQPADCTIEILAIANINTDHSSVNSFTASVYPLPEKHVLIARNIIGDTAAYVNARGRRIRPNTPAPQAAGAGVAFGASFGGSAWASGINSLVAFPFSSIFHRRKPIGSFVIFFTDEPWVTMAMPW